jgi:hypothetical protein
MTVLTMRMIKGDFVVTGPDVEPMKFKSHPEARDWCSIIRDRRSPRSDQAANGRRSSGQN